MNSTLSTAPGRHDHPPHPEPHLRPVRRVGLLDRLALHLGVALISWSRRPRVIPSRERTSALVQQQLAREARLRAAERALRLTVPPR